MEKEQAPDESAAVARWLAEIELSGKTEKDWREQAKEVVSRYRDAEKRSDRRFNILWSNTEVLRPHLYGATPKADVRQRFRDKDAIAHAASEVIERALDYAIDNERFDDQMALVILDYLLPGRAVARIRFTPVVEQTEFGERLSYARCGIERVKWESFRRGPATVKKEIPWVAYEHQLTMDEAKERFPDCDVAYDITMDGVDRAVAEKEPEVYQRVRVWEVLDSRTKEVIFLAPSCPSKFLKREPNPLNLEDFFDCEILYAVESGDSLIPIPEYEMYRDQAEELDRVTARIAKLTSALKVRGVYDAAVKEMKDLLTGGDNDMVPATAGTAAQTGGLDKAIWFMPIQQVAVVLKELYLAREQIKQTIYEIMGIGDILRGSTNPNETLGAQQLKAQTGSMRMQRRQRDVQAFVRNLLRKMAEVIAEHYPPELLALMTGVKLPTAEEKLSIQQSVAQAEQMQQQGMQVPAPPKDAMEILAQPTWDEVMQILRSDLLRSFRIDIESDSTIAADQASERQQVTELITGIGGYVQQMVPAVQSGLISQKAAKELLQAALRRFKFGRNIDDLLSEDEEDQPNETDAAQQQAMAAEQQKIQMEQQRMEFERQKHAESLQLEKYKADTQIQADVAKHQMKLDYDAKGKALMAEMSQRPAATIQFNAEDRLNGLAENIGGLVATQMEAVSALRSQSELMAQQQAQVAASQAEALAGLTQGVLQQGGVMQTALAQNAQAIAGMADAIREQSNILAAPREAVTDKSGKIIGSKVKLQ